MRGSFTYKWRIILSFSYYSQRLGDITAIISRSYFQHCLNTIRVNLPRCLSVGEYQRIDSNGILTDRYIVFGFYPNAAQ